MMRRARTRPIHALLAAAVLCLLVMPIAFAGAASGPQATASASVKKQVKKLKQQVNELRQQVEDLSKQPGPQGPGGAQGPPGPATGPAGGDLTGSYPNPQIGANSVGTNELQGNGVTEPKIAFDAVTDGAIATDAVGTTEVRDNAIDTSAIQTSAVRGPQIADSAVDADEIASNAITSPLIADATIESSDLAGNSVGGPELKPVNAVVGTGVTVNAGTPQNAEVTCPGARVLIGAGYAWQDDEASSIIASAPSESDPRRTWIVRGMVAAGSNTLYAWANCLQE